MAVFYEKNYAGSGSRSLARRNAEIKSGTSSGTRLLAFFIRLPLSKSAPMAMEARCYRGGENRTKMKPLQYKKRDGIAYLTLVCYLSVCIGANILIRLPFFRLSQCRG